MAESTITYKCPNCDAGLLFNASKQMFSCEFCLSDFTEEELLQKEASMNDSESDLGYEGNIHEYNCPSCGAEIIADDATAADFCYYCHNPVVLSDKVSGFLRPSKIIPFKFDKAEAKEIFLRYARKKKIIPKERDQMQ